jgi:hypothetical protein
MKTKESKIFPGFSQTELQNFKFPRRIQTIFPAKPIKPLKMKLIKYSLLTLLLNLLTLIIAVHENTEFGDRDVQVKDTQLHERMAVLVLSCLQGLVNINYWTIHVKIDKAYNKEYIKKSLIQGNSHKKQAIFEILTTFFIYPYNYNAVIYSDTSLFLTIDDFVTLLNLLRVYFVYKFIYDYSEYNSVRAHWVTNFAGVPNLMIFNLKSQMHSRMFRFILLNLLLSLLIFTLIVDIMENDLGKSSISFSDSAFLVIVTETTIGFGDILPNNFVSRIICVVASLFGTALIALLVIAINQTVDLSEKETSIYNQILLKQESRSLWPLALKIIQTFWRLQLKRMKKEQRFFLVIRLSTLLHKFKIKRKRITSKYYSGLKKNIESAENTSKKFIKNLSKELKNSENFSKNCLKLVQTEVKISELSNASKSNYRRMFHLFQDQKPIESSSRLLQSSRNSESNNLTSFKKKRDKAMKKLLMRYSNSPSSNSSLISPNN